MKEIYMLGLSFRTAPMEVREAFHFDSRETEELLKVAASVIPECELAILSTCNRTEFYLASEAAANDIAAMMSCVRRLRPEAPIRNPECLRHQAAGADAVRHLFRVAAGLESSVLGDRQILAQIREMTTRATCAGTMGPYLNRLFAEAMRAGQNARSKTKISHGAASLGSAIGEIIARHPDREGTGSSILVVGAGQVAADIGWCVSKRKLGSLIFVNRTDAKAQALAKQFGGKAAPWNEMSKAVRDASVVVAATSSPSPLIDETALEQLVTLRGGSLPLLIDAGMPRNMAVAEGVPVFDIDDIREQRESVLAQRAASIPLVEAVVEQAIVRWQQWMGARPREAAIADLYRGIGEFSALVAAEFCRGAGEERVQAKYEVERAMRRALHSSIRQLRQIPVSPAKPVVVPEARYSACAR